MKHAKAKHPKSVPAQPQDHNDEHLSIRIDDLAIPEIHTGHVEQTESLECKSCPVYYDCVAIPEIHFRDMLQCPAQNPVRKAE